MCIRDSIQAVEALVDVDRDWVPHSDGASLYIRPFVFANDVGLGVHASKHYIFCIICAPSGAYYAEGINPVRIYVEDEYIRAMGLRRQFRQRPSFGGRQCRSRRHEGLFQNLERGR